MHACSPRKRRGCSHARSCRSMTAPARRTPPTTACARIRRRKTSPGCGRSSTARTATSPPATARRSPTAPRGWCSRRSARSIATSSCRAGASSTPSGRRATRRSWDWVPCMRQRRCSRATSSDSTTSTHGRSTRRSRRRCWAACAHGKATRIAATSSACRARWGRSTIRGSTSTAARAHRRQARHRCDLCWRRPGRRDARRARARRMTMGHWTLTRADDGIATLTLDKQGASVNTLSADVMAEFGEALSLLDGVPPKGLVIRSGKPGGFIAGADIDEFRAVRGPDDGIAIVRRGAELFDRLARVPYPTLALISGFCLGGGLELALACRYRVGVDDPSTRMGLPEVMLGIVPGWGGIKRLPRLIGAPAALDLLLTGKTVDARRAQKLGLVDEAVPRRIVENTVTGMLKTLPPPRALPFALSLTLHPLMRKFIASQAAKKLARRARREHYPAPYTILALFERFDGEALAPPANDPASMQALLGAPFFGNLIRVFTLQERLKSLGGNDGDGAKARHVHVVGAGTMGGDIAAWCALRGLIVTLQDQDAARLAPAMGRAARLFTERLKDARRVRDAVDRLIPDIAGDGVARADVIIEAIFEDAAAKRALFAAVEKKARAGAILATNTSSIPLEEIALALADPSRLIGLHFFNPVAKMMLVEVVVGAQTAAALLPRALAFVRQVDKLPLPVKSAPGFLVNRVLAPYLMAAMPPGWVARLIDPMVAEAHKALAEGVVADADLVDAGAIFGAGFAPFRGGPLYAAAHASTLLARA